ncbi:MAG TPA: hypothetical protein DCG75_01545 [Bacteroidales bacterium]|nr:hypothetical protein [Bacteroidales bacterium]
MMLSLKKMKKLLPVVLGICLLYIACDEMKEDKIPGQLTYEKTTFDGCFSEASITKADDFMHDTIYTEISGNSLKLVVVMNYNCRGTLTGQYEISDDNLVEIKITDSCTGDYCLCNCICTFIFNYYFTGFENKTIDFDVYLNGYYDDDDSLWKSFKYSP